jgi:hypothetical protein
MDGFQIVKWRRSLLISIFQGATYKNILSSHSYDVQVIVFVTIQKVADQNTAILSAGHLFALQHSEERSYITQYIPRLAASY